MRNIRKAVVFILTAVMLLASVTGAGLKAATGDEYTVQPADGKENLTYAGATGTLFVVDGRYNGFCIDRDRGHYSAATSYKEAAGIITDPADKLYQTFYYGYGGPGYGEVYSFANETEAIVATNQAASHFRAGSQSGMNYTEAIENLDSSMIPPEHGMSLTPSSAAAYESGGRQVTDWITLNLDSRLSAEAAIPEGVTLWIEGESSGHTGRADIRGGSRFYLSAGKEEDGIKNVTLSYTGNKMLQIIILDPPDAAYQPVAFYTSVNPTVNLGTVFTGTGELEIIKTSANPAVTDDNGCYSLEGAVYGVYASYGNAYNDTDRIASITTDANGYGRAAGLARGTYYVKELTAPKGFKADKGIYTAVINSATVATRLNVRDEPGNDPLEIVVRKKDADGDIYLNGAKFVVKYYDVQMDTDPAESGKTPKRTWYLVTGEGNNYSGAADLNVKNLDPSKASDEFYMTPAGDPTIPYGTITVREYEAPEGYITDDTVYTFKITADLNSTPTVDILNRRTVTNRKIKQPFAIKKYGRYPDGDIPLSGAGFMAAPVSVLNTDEEGNYIWDESKAVILTPDGEKELITDESGYALSVSLDYGRYLVHETTVPAHFLPCEDFIVEINTASAEPKEYTRYDEYNPPELGTSAADGDTGNSQGKVGEKASIIDRVRYKNLVVGKEYTIKGILIDKSTGKPFTDGGKEITAEKTFTAAAASGSIDMEYTFSSKSLAGKELVVFETLYYDGTEIAAHNDLEDEEQTVKYPELGTSAADGDTGNSQGKVGEKASIIDRVRYKNLVVGKEYTIKGILIDKSTGKPFTDGGKEITAEKTFTAAAASGSIDMEYTFSSKSLAGKELVVFETLYYDGTEIAAHNDLEDEEQTVKYPDDEVNTGDGTPVTAAAVFMLLAGAGIMLLRKETR